MVTPTPLDVAAILGLSLLREEAPLDYDISKFDLLQSSSNIYDWSKHKWKSPLIVHLNKDILRHQK